MARPVIVKVNKGYDFSGIEGHERFATPAYAVAMDAPNDPDYRYAEVYGDGTLRLRGNLWGYDGVTTFFNYNPYSQRGYFSDSANASKDRIVPQTAQLLRSAGVPESVITPANPDNIDSIMFGDPHAGSLRDSAHRLTEIALNALQFSRWYNYDTSGFDRPILNMGRGNYAQALGAIAGRFGPLVLANEAKQLIDCHFESLHTALHTPGLTHKPHSDGTPKDEAYMDTAWQVIRGSHELPKSMRRFGMWVNFLSLFGDADFWAVTREAHPEVFDAAVTHLLEMPDPYTQPKGMYGNGALISPVGLIQSYFAEAHREIVFARPEFKSDMSLEQSLIIQWHPGDYSDS